MKKSKIVLVGDGGVGKTTFLNRYLDGDFTKKYIPTLGVEVHPISIKIENEVSRFDIWDCAGQEKFGGLRDGYFINSDACILMCDVTSKITFKSIGGWINTFRNVCPEAPIILVITKHDTVKTNVSAKERKAFAAYHNLQYVMVSSKTNYNHGKPFKMLKDLLQK